MSREYCDTCKEVTEHQYVGDDIYECTEHSSVAELLEETNERRYG